ncbi:trehalase-domain-containing protein [Cokeromyces recurvatus]|uniref:trehalase-domain-containing protein n=1 Tax=Cokeromyces recurvatus TaxID=90255 RepID=UPI00221F5178|nr:trehalase-domain-containing protein [Cokeromyces recurvatus]KAI7907751.1 trehalase-domain-containing protein [Cokeromyces recurvatus]
MQVSTAKHVTILDQEEIIVDVHAPAKTYYTTGSNAGNVVHRLRTLSGQQHVLNNDKNDLIPPRKRRGSHDDKYKARKFLLDVKDTQRVLVEQEDTDGDFQITVNDLGPKTLSVGSADSGGYRKIEIRGTYMLSNLLQELALAEDYGRKYIVLDEARLSENPVDRLSRMIRHHFWDGLTRRIDAEGLERICMDPKNRSANHSPRIYIPYDEEEEVFEYYQNVANTKKMWGLEVERLPQDITAEYVQGINDRPGILSLALKKVVTDIETGEFTFIGVPFVVPGGRFNEMYGWDSYFEALGLLIDDRLELAQGMVENFAYEIKHYGKILNANRSYYLTRSQPPFLTDMARQVYLKLTMSDDENKEWLRSVLQAAIKEYHTVWMAEPRLDPKTQLSRFRPDGKGIPPETEASHFDHVIQPYASRAGLSIVDYMEEYNKGTLIEPELDEYFLHDRAVRESGHDTTYRYEGRCADLATIDLNSLLYKYETDIADMITDYLNDDLVDYHGVKQDADIWRERARLRLERMNTYLWNEEKGMYFDYDTVKGKQSDYETVTTFWTMWAKCASQEQVEKMIHLALPKFEVMGGLVSGTAESRGIISLDRPNRQWDFPFGWAPHQILAWKGFENYGKTDIQQRLAYRWLYMITKSFVDFNGVVPEKYDVVSLTHKVQVEYGNVGVDFKYIPREGFGWMNASYQIGLSMITKQMRRALGTCTRPDLFFEKYLARKQQEESIKVVQAAREITQDGQTTTAITLIVPSESSVIIQDSFNSSYIQRKTPVLTPENSNHDIIASALIVEEEEEVITPHHNHHHHTDYFSV